MLLLLRQVMPIEALGLVVLLGVGCRTTSAPPEVAVPPQGHQTSVVERDPVKPLPPPSRAELDLTPRYSDAPLVNDRPPEEAAYIDAYRRIGSPRIAVFVNRTLQGELIDALPAPPDVSVTRVRRATTGVSVEDGTYRRTETGSTDETRRSDSRFESEGAGEYSETTDVYLRPGQYDEADARSIDYEAMEMILTDWLAGGGQVSIVSPIMARQRLTDEQLRALESGRPQALSEVAEQLGADVLVQVQARPTRQMGEGLEVRVLAEAFNTRGGESLARAVVDVQPPLSKQRLNTATRYVARSLMDDMIQSWSTVPAAPERNPAPAQQDRRPQQQ